jgi:streptogramin lyase
MSSAPRTAAVATRGWMRPRPLRGERSREKGRARRRLATVLLSAVLTALSAGLLLPAAATAQAVVEFPAPPGSNPGGITAGPDGALWFVGEGTSTVYRMTTAGVIDPPSGFPVTISGTDTSVSTLDEITAGPDGALWFTQPRDAQIGRITTGGAITEYPVPGTGPVPEAITVGPDGNIWFTATGLLQIGRMTLGGSVTMFPGAGAGASDIAPGPDGALWFTESLASPSSIGRISIGGGAVTHFPVPTDGSEPSGITPGPGGGFWFTESAANQIGFITTGGTVTEYPGAGIAPSAIQVGRDGALWFTESDPAAGAIGRITTGGIVTNHFPVPTPGSEPSDLTTGPDGALWFTEFLGNKVGRIETAPVVTPPPPPPRTKIVSPKRKRCKVPKVRGLTVKKAKKKLKRARCKYRFRGKGRVVSTKPKAGKRTSKTVRVKARPKKKGKRSKPTSRATSARDGAVPRMNLP